uniref:Uncharacterized protein n=1 Tax=Nelumbo nucifera TaxID=4432 RepID=A0A822YD56_NELNU|nr:TPA_asm: hypothetical protein HUJ06_010915 [Nelumbo nucifera]
MTYERGINPFKKIDWLPKLYSKNIQSISAWPTPKTQKLNLKELNSQIEWRKKKLPNKLGKRNIRWEERRKTLYFYALEDNTTNKCKPWCYRELRQWNLTKKVEDDGLLIM